MALPAISYSTSLVPRSLDYEGRQGDILLSRVGAQSGVHEDVFLRTGTGGGFVYFDPVTNALGVTNAPKGTITNYTADGAIALTTGFHTVSKTSAAAMTVAAPTAAQDGTRLVISAGTNFAHVITFTGSTLLDGTTGANLTVTMTAFIGSSITVYARSGTWILESSSNVTSITA
jgi:hypothetical protein